MACKREYYLNPNERQAGKCEKLTLRVDHGQRGSGQEHESESGTHGGSDELFKDDVGLFEDFD